MKVDYHLHSLNSDGIYTVEEIIALLLDKKIECFSITDHDTVAGIPAARRSSRDKIGFITGIEITCTELFLPSVEMSFSVHLLGYGFDETNSVLVNKLDVRNEQVKRLYEMLCQEITDCGFPVTVKEIPISCGNELQLCDVADFVDSKYGSVCTAENNISYIFELIGSYVAKLDAVNISLADGIALIHNAGGKAVWAHPFCVYHDCKKMNISYRKVELILEHLKALGLDGLEANYSAFCESDRKWLRELALGAGMIYTAGSDFHGFAGRDFMGMEIDSNQDGAYE